MPNITQLNKNKSYRIDKTSYLKFELKKKTHTQKKQKKTPQNVKKTENNLIFNSQI